MRKLLAACFVAACGPTATLAPVVAQQPVRAPPAKPAPTTCGEAGVILRGAVADVKKERKAGPAKEAAIAHTCLYDKWSAEVLECIGGKLARTAKVCVDQLTSEQHDAYDKQLAKWAAAFEETLADAKDPDQDDPVDDEVECATGIGDVAKYGPAVTAVGDERDLVITWRKDALLTFCETGWSNSAKRCFDAGTLPPDGCRALLDGSQQAEVTAKLADLDAMLKKLLAAKQKPATIDCKHVVAVHYSDGAWKGKAEPPIGPATKTDIAKAASIRKAAIVDSRTAMTKACTNEQWSATERACMVAVDSEVCFAGQDTWRWGFPAVGVVLKTGVFECDAYSASHLAFMACNKFPDRAKESMRRSFDGERALWLNTPPTERAKFAAGCKTSDEALHVAAQSLGCTI